MKNNKLEMTHENPAYSDQPVNSFENMKTFELSEFTSLLRLELWRGGHISGLGYISPACKADRKTDLSGLIGLRLARGITLEDIRREGVDSKLFFSIHDPYEGEYLSYEASACFEIAIREAFNAIVTRTEKGKERQRGQITSSSRLFRKKMRYGSTQHNMRGSSIPYPKRRR